jgi:hypothetical protein
VTDQQVMYQLITHKSEVVLVLSAPLTTMSFTAAQARTLAQALTTLADTLEAQTVSKDKLQ